MTLIKPTFIEYLVYARICATFFTWLFTDLKRREFKINGRKFEDQYTLERKENNC